MRVAPWTVAGHRAQQSLAPDLFPFLSLFLCLFGVLAFLQVLLALTGSQKVELVADAAEDYRIPFRIYCLADGMLVVPPTERLGQLVRAAAAEHAYIERIRDRRRRELDWLERRMASSDSLPMVYAGGSELQQRLDEIVALNQAARAAGILYEEFILFGIYPGGGATYQRIRQVLQEPAYAAIGIGLEALDSGWQPVL